MRNYIHLKTNELNHENINGNQIWWEFLINRVTREVGNPWKQLNFYEQNLKCAENEDYLRCKLRLEEIYKIKANGVKISKFDWCEYEENSSKFFLNLEKRCFIQSQIRKLVRPFIIIYSSLPTPNAIFL